ncbi:MAG: efflux transporter periplasmic adaptor subunit [Nitrospirae bacterium GWC2_57_13]|jgi:RND family efflux transporter MFP subunit|nr:MAG: efflux transporter periplasmic adaptor subunit [Nitrospirae bacterium GWC2_57_13]
MANEDLAKLRIDKSAANFRKKQKRPKLGIVAVALFLIVAVLYLVSSGSAVVVETALASRVYPSQSFTLLSASGYVVAQRKAAVASKATGRLEWLGVEEGSKVKKGEVIARLEARDVAAAREQAAANLNNVRSSLEQAQAELEVAKRDFARSTELLEKGFIAKMDYDAAEARFKRAQAGVSGAGSAINASKAALDAADVAVEYTRIRAPFDAVVLTKDADVGDIVTPLGAASNARASVVTIADMSSLLVEADVSESSLAKVKAGQPTEIQLDAFPDSRFRGAVHMIVPTADRTKASVMVKVRFLDRDLRVLPEMSARVAFLERPVAKNEQDARTGVSPAAVVERNGKKVLFVVKNGRVVETPVTTGGKLGDMVEILSGVEAGSAVVLNPPKKLQNNDRVTVKGN